MSPTSSPSLPTSSYCFEMKGMHLLEEESGTDGKNGGYPLRLGEPGNTNVLNIEEMRLSMMNGDQRCFY